MRLWLFFLRICVLCCWTTGYVVEWNVDGIEYIIKRRTLEGIRIENIPEVEQALDLYMSAGMKDVIGWFDYQALLAIRVVSSHQIQNGVRGGVVEIGVHHGKSFAALCLLNSDAGNEAGLAIAVDVFDDQHLNVDASGEGDLSIFKETLRMWCGEKNMKPDRLQIIQQDSRTLTSANILAHAGRAMDSAAQRVRLFSIDGSHTAEATHTDLTTAAGCLSPGGIVILDDYFAEGWPGVSEGALRFLLAQRPGASRLVPFFIGFNKIFLATEEYAGMYMEALSEGREAVGDDTMQSKVQEMLGSPVLVLSEEVRCSKHTRSLLPGECVAAGRCRAETPDAGGGGGGRLLRQRRGVSGGGDGSDGDVGGTEE